jgi:DDE family transposase
MLTRGSILVSFLWRVEQIPTPPPPAHRQRGRQATYSDKLFVKALIVMIIRRLSTAYALLHFLEQDDPVALQLRPLLTEHGRFPTRRPWERRFAKLPARLPVLIGCLGRPLVELLQPWAKQGHAAAIASTPLRANGGVWHKQHRLAGEVPHASIDTEAAWSKSGYHGWWYGWKLPLAVVVGSVWLPLAAECTIASAADNVIAPKLLEQLPMAVRYVLGDTHYNTPELRDECALHNRELVATRRGPYPHRDGGVEVRRLLHKLRSLAIEPFNGVFKNTFEWRGQMPGKGLKCCQLFALGAILLYQIVLLYQHQRQQPVGVGIKALLRAA